MTILESPAAGECRSACATKLSHAIDTATQRHYKNHKNLRQSFPLTATPSESCRCTFPTLSANADARTRPATSTGSAAGTDASPGLPSGLLVLEYAVRKEPAWGLT